MTRKIFPFGWFAQSVLCSLYMHTFDIFLRNPPQTVVLETRSMIAKTMVSGKVFRKSTHSDVIGCWTNGLETRIESPSHATPLNSYGTSVNHLLHGPFSIATLVEFRIIFSDSRGVPRTALSRIGELVRGTQWLKAEMSSVQIPWLMRF